MFSIVGNLNFIYDLEEFETFTNSILTVIDASVGNFDTNIFVKLDPPMQVVGEIYIISIVVCFNILLMNLIIAILASTFERFDSKSNGLYLSKILVTRDELIYDVSYGSIFSATPPLNALQIPFFPALFVLRYDTDILNRINEFVMKIQYVSFMLVLKLLFAVVSIALIPFAWIMGIVDKLMSIGWITNSNEKLMNNYLFIPFGPVILALDVVADLYYFWINNFRQELKQIIIPKDESKIT